MADKTDFDRWNVPPRLRRRMRDAARDLRKQPTPTEAKLWAALRKRQLAGKKFRRQAPIGPFIVDFFCPAERLIVEVDGGIHQTQIDADRERQSLLEGLGLCLVRISAERVEADIDGALEEIRAAFTRDEEH